MQNKTYKNFISRLLNDGKATASSIGESVRQSGDFNSLIAAGLIEQKPSVTGGTTYYLKNRPALESYFNEKFPTAIGEADTAIYNVHAFRNSKAAKKNSQNVVLLRGRQSVFLNHDSLDLLSFTEKFNVFSCVLKELDTQRVCLVENLDSFLLAENCIDSSFVFVHTYGGIGRSVISKVKAEEILVFPDYDFKGLHTYLLAKSIHLQTRLYVPENYDDLFKQKSRTIKTRNGREQQPSKAVLNSTDEMVVKIRTDIFKTKMFLEQQAIFQ